MKIYNSIHLYHIIIKTNNININLFHIILKKWLLFIKKLLYKTEIFINIFEINNLNIQKYY